MADFTLYYWPVPFRGQFIRAILAHAGKSCDEPENVAEVMGADPDKQPVPFMGPPMLIDEATGFKLAEMPAIAFYLGETLDLLPEGREGHAMTIKVVNDANDIIDEVTIDGGSKMWTPETWKDYMPRLKRWMTIFEVLGRRNGLTADAGFLLGTDKAGVADIVTATLWGTMTDRFPKIGEIFAAQAPAIAGLTRRVMATEAMQTLDRDSRKRFGDAWCGGQIEKSLRKVVNGE